MSTSTNQASPPGGGSSFRQTPSRMKQRRQSSTDDFVNESISNLAGIDENSAVLVKYSFMFIGMLSILKILTQSLFYVYVLFLPGVYMYLSSSCPKEADFNAKEELKLVMDGTSLPESHPSKPKGYLDSLFSKAKARVASEVSSFTGMKEEYTSVVGAILFVTVTAPAVGRKFYWIGAVNKFRFINSTLIETPSTKKGE